MGADGEARARDIRWGMSGTRRARREDNVGVPEDTAAGTVSVLLDVAASVAVAVCVAFCVLSCCLVVDERAVAVAMADDAVGMDATLTADVHMRVSAFAMSLSLCSSSPSARLQSCVMTPLHTSK